MRILPKRIGEIIRSFKKCRIRFDTDEHEAQASVILLRMRSFTLNTEGDITYEVRQRKLKYLDQAGIIYEIVQEGEDDAD